MRYILTLLLVSMLSLSYSQTIDKRLTKKSNIVIQETDMLGGSITVIKDKRGNRLYIEHTLHDVTRFTIYKNNKAYEHGFKYPAMYASNKKMNLNPNW
tara:strand:+ start:465 stop:758 length:294 start_codon:yes stop_codon:yes gene_type:complete